MQQGAHSSDRHSEQRLVLLASLSMLIVVACAMNREEHLKLTCLFQLSPKINTGLQYATSWWEESKTFLQITHLEWNFFCCPKIYQLPCLQFLEKVSFLIAGAAYLDLSRLSERYVKCSNISSPIRGVHPPARDISATNRTSGSDNVQRSKQLKETLSFCRHETNKTQKTQSTKSKVQIPSCFIPQVLYQCNASLATSKSSWCLPWHRIQVGGLLITSRLYITLKL